ncbi:MAG: hypothetical protein U9N46_06060 [Euryarchaeota archaeon]|nr:hypothetical protein [Euryarchaeota archaeon]
MTEIAAIALRPAVSGVRNPAADVSSDNHITSLDALIVMQAAHHYSLE